MVDLVRRSVGVTHIHSVALLCAWRPASPKQRLKTQVLKHAVTARAAGKRVYGIMDCCDKRCECVNTVN